MSPRRLVLLIESDPNAIAQMRRVLAGMKMRAIAVSDEDSLGDAIATLVRTDAPPVLIVARVALPSGSGIRMLEETAARYPKAQQMLISHHPRNLLFAVPGFADHSANFLQAEFSDDQFRLAVERALARGSAAG
jgi:DNA-binding NtrC family response regulator